MISADAARTVVGVLGNVISLFLFLSPMPTFIRIWKKGAVEQYSPVPYLATLVNCMLWVLYGIPLVHPNSTLVMTINGSGTAIEVIFILVFLFYCSDPRKRLRILVVLTLELALIAALSTLVLTIVHTHDRRSMIVGIICVLFTIMMYASPLSIMKLVITTKSVEYMPFFLSLASFANGLCWTIYAIIRFDIFIVVPNGIGSIFGLAQLILYATYYKSTKEQIAARRLKGEMSLSEVVVNGGHSKKVGDAGHASSDVRACNALNTSTS
ncbi:bidirectional sugar transporter SWEET4-like [Punica granatum]|uniref:Bidirectional sugar transporter SWEET n=2 Tax=Punica granatum TaxID=22663 RepID=A0A6P8CFZ7_PUNGR|nr:bidirectional sugar transporter SWEET4-like [Punica granatum]